MNWLPIGGSTLNAANSRRLASAVARNRSSGGCSERAAKSYRPCMSSMGGLLAGSALAGDEARGAGLLGLFLGQLLLGRLALAQHGCDAGLEALDALVVAAHRRLRRVHHGLLA